jgi:putative peptidoglycan lipid II flippase
MPPSFLAPLANWHEGSAHRRVLAAAGVVAFFTFGARLAGAAKEIVVASRFGTSDAVDAFVLAFLIPSFAIGVVGGSLNSALVPAYVEARERTGPEAAQRLLSTTMALSVTLLVALALALGALVPAVLPLMASSFVGAKLQLTRELCWLLLPCIVVAGTTMTWTAVLNAHQRFAPSAFASLLVPTLAMISVLVYGDRWGVRALAVGTFAGYLAEACWVGVSLRRLGTSIVPRLGDLTPAVRQVLRQYVPMAAGMLVMNTNSLVDSIMAARLATGSVASLGYGNKLIAFGMGIGSVSLSSAVFPLFASLAASRDWARLARTIRLYARILLALTIPVTLAGIALSGPIVRLLFERGAFTPADTLSVARIQALYLLQIPFHLTGMLFVRFASAIGANRVLMRVSMLSALVNVGGNYVLSLYMGPAGIALSTSVVYAFTFAYLARFTSRRLQVLCSGVGGQPAPARR